MSDSRIRLDYRNVMASAVGDANGLTDAQLEAIAQKATNEIERIWAEHAAGDQKWIDLPDNKALVDEIDAFADENRSKYDDFILIGIGGSSLGAISAIQALAHPYRNLLPADRRGGPRFFVLDNPDPEKVSATLSTVDLSKTLVNVVTKSGQTAETMANFLVAQDALQKAVGKEKSREQIVATTDPESGLLRKLADLEGYRTFPVPPGVDGRQTVLSAVGMLPAAMCGVDIGGLLDGAAAMRERCKSTDIFENAAALFASIAYLADTDKGKSILVSMPYADSLFGIADWFRQLWAESLGKRLGTDGKEVFAGQTPIKALGAIDQHSQIQLYTEGPERQVALPDGRRPVPCRSHHRRHPGGHSRPRLSRWRRTRHAARPRAHCHRLGVDRGTAAQLDHDRPNHRCGHRRRVLFHARVPDRRRRRPLWGQSVWPAGRRSWQERHLRADGPRRLRGLEGNPDEGARGAGLHRLKRNPKR